MICALIYMMPSHHPAVMMHFSLHGVQGYGER